MSESNPYQSPQAEVPEPPSITSERPSLLRCSLFGLYCGAIAGATSGGLGMMLVGVVAARMLGEMLVAAAVGGAYFGVIMGGLVGAVLGSPVAVIIRAAIEKPTNLQHFAAAVPFAVAFAALGAWFGMRLAHGQTGVAANAISAEAFTRAIVLSLLIGILSGIAGGWYCSAQAGKFALQADSRRRS